MVAVRDLSKSDGAFKYLIYLQYSTLKDFPQVELVPLRGKEELHKIWSMEDVFAILPTGYLSSLPTSNVSNA